MILTQIIFRKYVQQLGIDLLKYFTFVQVIELGIQSQYQTNGEMLRFCPQEWKIFLDIVMNKCGDEKRKKY